MNHSRRTFGLLLSALAAGKAAERNPTLPSTMYLYDDLPVRTRGPNAVRPIFNGAVHSGFAVELHESELAAGEAPHPPHHHVHEEVVIVHEGILEVTIAGRKARLGPGSVAFVAANEEHGWRNAGNTRARYYLFAIGPDWDYRQRVGS